MPGPLRRSRSRLPRAESLFQWNIETQDLVDLPTCVPRQISITTRLNDTALAFPYHLTVFAIGKKPEEILVEPDADGLTNFMVKEPLGAEFMLRLRDANGIEGGFLPSIFQAVAGITTSCIDTASTLSSNHGIAGTWKPSSSFDLEVVGGVPPYDLTVALLGPSSSSVVKTRLTQFQFIQPVTNNRTKALVAAISDSNGEWVSETSLIHFRDPAFKMESNPAVSISVHSLRNMTNSPNAATIGSLMNLRAPITHSSVSQHIFGKRDTSDGGSTIMIVDAVVLALLLGIALAVAIREYILRRRKRKQARDLLLQNLDVETLQGNPPTTNLGENTRDQPVRETIDERYSSSSEDMKLSTPPTPPASPTTPVTISPVGTVLTSTPTLSRLVTVPLPEIYGDPYPSSTRDMYGAGFPLVSSRPTSSGRSTAPSNPRSVSRASSNRHPSLMSRPSFSSIFSVRASRSGGRFTRFSESYYPDEPALSDARSAVLAREISRSSSNTMLGTWGGSRRQSSAPPPPRPNESDITDGGWLEVSDSAPAVPPLVFTHGDL